MKKQLTCFVLFACLTLLTSKLLGQPLPFVDNSTAYFKHYAEEKSVKMPLENTPVIAPKNNYSYYKFKFDLQNPEHVRIMDNPTQAELDGYANQLELAAKDPEMMQELDVILAQAELIYQEALGVQNFKEADYRVFKELLREKIKIANDLAADRFDPVNGFRGGIVGTCMSHHPVMRVNEKILKMMWTLKSKTGFKRATSRNAPNGKLTVNTKSMYTTSNFLSTIAITMNGDPDMPQDLVGEVARFETIPATLPSWMTFSASSPSQNWSEVGMNLEDNGLWGGVDADVFHFEGISTVIGTGTSVNNVGFISSCEDSIPNVGFIVGSTTNTPIRAIMAHEMTHGIAAILHTNTAADMTNNEVMRPAVNINSNYWNVVFTITPFWQQVNLANDCLNAAITVPVELLDFTGKLDKNDKITLNWRTATEQNTEAFDVEQSADAKTFEKIGMVKARGSNSIYVFTDEQGLKSITYYRLKIKDFDGKTSYSKVLSFNAQNAAKVRIFPTYTEGSLFMENVKTFEIMNGLGQVVSTVSNIQHLPSGMYFVQGIDVNGAFFTQKVFKY
jgi:hypothetical protein